MSIFGAKGGGGGSSYSESPDTARTKSFLTIVDFVGRGPCRGYDEPLKHIALDGTRIQNADGSMNYKGVTVQQRFGHPTQEHVNGLEELASEFSVGADVRADLPVVRTVTNAQADAARITIAFQRITESDGNDVRGSRVDLAIDVQPEGGAWRTVKTDTINEKSGSPVQYQYFVPLPEPVQYNVRVRRLTPDAKNMTVQNAFTWHSFSEVIYGKFMWPNTAYFVLKFDAQLFGGRIPTRTYMDYPGREVLVPSNYDPETRTYAGAYWDGTFKRAWTDNPAWVVYDVATSADGLGLEDGDKWTLYNIGRMCDELVDDGFGGREPRFSINTVISDTKQAQEVLTGLVSAFRGSHYWSGTALRFTQDAPGPVERIFTPANVIKSFTYQSSADTSRTNIVNVAFADKAQGGTQSVETYTDAEGIRGRGTKIQQDVTAPHVGSRAQARRFGKWKAYTDQHETERVSFSVSYADAGVRPGMIIGLHDPKRAGVRMGGRITGYDANTLTLTVDAVPEKDRLNGTDWTVGVYMPDNKLDAVACTIVDGHTLKLQRALRDVPQNAAVWAVYGRQLAPTQWRVITIAEEDNAGEFLITALEHHPNKYSWVERGERIDDVPTSVLPTGAILPPRDLTVLTYTENSGTQVVQSLTLSWRASPDPRATGYLVGVRGPNDATYRLVGDVTAFSIDMKDVADGEWTFRVCATGPLSASSPWASTTAAVGGLLLPHPPVRVEVQSGNRDQTLVAISDGRVQQEFEFWQATTALQDQASIETNGRLVGIGTTVSASGLTPNTEYFYYIRGVNMRGRSSWYPVQARTTLNIAEERAALEKEIVAPGGLLDTAIHQSAADITATVADKLTKFEAAIPDTVRPMLTNVEDQLAAQKKAFSAYKDEQKTAIDALTLRVEVDRAAIDTAAAQIETARAETATATTAMAAGVTRIDSKVDTTEAHLLEVLHTEAEKGQRALSEKTATLAAQIAGVDSRVDERVRSEVTAREGAIADVSRNLAAGLGEVHAESQRRELVQASENQAVRLELLLTQVHIETAKAIVATNSTITATRDTAAASQTTAVSAALDNMQAEVTQTITTKVDRITQWQQAQYMIKTKVVNGVPAIIGVESNNHTSAVRIMAAEFSLTDGRSAKSPFVMRDGRLWLGDVYVETQHFGEYIRSSNWDYRGEYDFTGVEIGTRTGKVYASEFIARKFTVASGSSGARNVFTERGQELYADNGNRVLRIGIFNG